MYSARCSCPILTKLQFSRQIFNTFANTKLHGNRSVEAELLDADGWADNERP